MGRIGMLDGRLTVYVLSLARLQGWCVDSIKAGGLMDVQTAMDYKTFVYLMVHVMISIEVFGRMCSRSR